MTTFLRLVDVPVGDKATALEVLIRDKGEGVYEIDVNVFRDIPGSPFAYWTDSAVRSLFAEMEKFESRDRIARRGLQTSGDPRHVRVWWEVLPEKMGDGWANYAKGGQAQVFFADLFCIVRWDWKKKTIPGFMGRPGRRSETVECADLMGKAGLTWPLRAARFSPSSFPSGSVFSARGYVILASKENLLWLLGITSSKIFDYLFKTCLGRTGYPEFIVGILQKLPLPTFSLSIRDELASLARRAWSLTRSLSFGSEISHAFILPNILLNHVAPVDKSAVANKLKSIQSRIDEIAMHLYGLSDVVEMPNVSIQMADQESRQEGNPETREDSDEDGEPLASNDADDLLSWCVGVAFGRFDVGRAIRQGKLPREPDPFDSLPSISPGMLIGEASSFHSGPGVMVDDPGHPHDLRDLVTRVLECVGVELTDDIPKWLRIEFFSLHLKKYSRGGRVAPIYWPISTPAGDYTLWLYYPALTSQTLFVAANDFIGTKLERQVEPALQALRQKTNRSREEEQELEGVQTLHDELRTLRDELLRLAPTWKPNHDDGVQINAAPLWRLFRHRPWQIVLRDTWDKLEQGHYDWSHLAMTYWPNRVGDKCRTDASLAIAHDLEHLYEPPPEAPPKAGRGRGKKG